MCESLELARILDVSGSLLKSTCRQNSAIASFSIMAKIRLAEKVEVPSTLHLEPISDKRSSSPTAKMSSKVHNSISCSYSSSLDSEDSRKYLSIESHPYDNIDDIINGVHSIQMFDSDTEKDSEVRDYGYKNNLIVSSEDEKSETPSDEEDNEEGLIERGPVRPSQHTSNRSNPYIDSPHHWASCGLSQPNENLTDYDTSAKEILRDREYREKIDFCLDKLSDMSQERSMTNSLSPAHSDFGGLPTYSPVQQQQWSPSSSGASGSSGFVPSITVCDSESTLLEILSRGGFQPARASRTPEHGGSVACASDNWPDSPASSYNACATSASRPDSRASSRAQSPGSNNGCGVVSFLNVLGSPMGSPQVSPQNFRNLQRPSSSSSSSQSYCETPSPANYQNPLDQHLEEQLGDHIMTRMPAWRDSFESSDTLVNSVDSNELQLQLVEEVIRGDINGDIRGHDMQVVPNCRSISTTSSTNSYSMENKNHMTSSGASSGLDGEDDLTNTLLRFVGDEQAIASHQKTEARASSITSGYSSSSSSEAWKVCDGSCMQYEQPIRNDFIGPLSSPPRHQPQQQSMVYQQQCMNLNTSVNVGNLQYSTAPVEMLGRNSWQNYPESNSIIGNSSSNRHFNDFQIPETVTSYNSQRSKSSNTCTAKSCSERTITPWPSLNLPSTRASERLKEVTDPREVERAMKYLLKKPLDQLAKADEDGDTMLMCLAGNPQELRKKLAYLAPLVERLGTIDGALSMLNSRGEDALYLAVMNCPQMAFVTGYLAAAFLQKNIDIGQRLYRSKGDTLVHVLAAKGDTHGEVLAELLSLKTAQGNPVFDLLKRNYDGRTALHIAADAYDSSGRKKKTVSVGSIRLLLDNGADPTIREVRCGDTALHLAVSLSCDPALVKALLTGRGREAVNIANYNGNTPLHMAAAISERTSLERQSEICWHLVHAGARSNLTNRQGKAPLALASPERKEALRRILHKKT